MKRVRIFNSVLKRCKVYRLVFIYLVLFYLVSIALYFSESSITNLQDALWYTFVSSTSIGYGDFVATTVIGRLLTAFIVLCEIILLAIISGVVVTYYLEVVHRREKESLTLLIDKLERLPELSKEELEEISRNIKNLK